MKLEDFIKKHGNVSVNEKELKELLGIKGNKYFIPKEYEEYFLVDFAGEIYGEDNNSDYDKQIYENNEVFRTEEEAQEHARKQRFLLQMKRDFLDNSDEIDWKVASQDKHTICYNVYTENIYIDTWQQLICGTLATTNEKWLKEYIEKYEEEIKKYYFEIKEEN